MIYGLWVLKPCHARGVSVRILGPHSSPHGSDCRRLEREIRAVSPLSKPWPRIIARPSETVRWSHAIAPSWLVSQRRLLRRSTVRLCVRRVWMSSAACLEPAICGAVCLTS
jgi:hypothetical protein